MIDDPVIKQWQADGDPIFIQDPGPKTFNFGILGKVDDIAAEHGISRPTTLAGPPMDGEENPFDDSTYIARTPNDHPQGNLGCTAEEGEEDPW